MNNAEKDYEAQMQNQLKKQYHKLDAGRRRKCGSRY